MDASFIPVGNVPSRTPFGLDQIRRSYKTALSAEAAIAAAPAAGTADETFASMFLMEISTPETAESATRIDLVYMGSLSGDATFIPIGVVPSKTPLGLDQLRRSYRAFLSAEDALAAAPALGTADATYPNMLLTEISTPASITSPTRIELVYIGSMSDDATFIPIEVVPSSTPFALDQLRRSYRVFLSAEDALAAAPALGTADATYGNMFLTQVSTPAAKTTPTRIDLLYMGTFTGTLPAVKNAKANPVQTATSFTSSAIFPAVATVPASLQYHAHTTSITGFSTSDTSATDPPDPAAVTVDDLITWTLAAEQPAGSFSGIAAWLLANAFTQNIVATEDADEIVPGQYYQITKRKTMQLFPYAPP